MQSGSLQRFSGEIGEEYDAFQEAVPWHDAFQDAVVDVLAAAFNERMEGPRLLEAGFGTGITTYRVLKRISGADIVAIDNVPNMEILARANLGSVMSKQVRFVIGDLLAELRRLPDDHFDGFYSAYVLHNIPSDIRKEVFSEIRRIVKSDGIFVNGDRIALDDPERQKLALANAINNCGVFLEKHENPDLYLEWVRHYLRDEEPDLFFRAKAQVDILEELGFAEVGYVFQKDLESVCRAVNRKA